MSWITECATIALAASSAIAAQPAPDISQPLGVNDVGRLIAVKPGEEIRIALPNPIGSNYTWQILLQKHVALIAPIETKDKPQIAWGEADTRQVAVIRLRAPRTGSASVLLGQVRDGGGGGNASNSYRFRFRVVP